MQTLQRLSLCDNPITNLKSGNHIADGAEREWQDNTFRYKSCVILPLDCWPSVSLSRPAGGRANAGEALVNRCAGREEDDRGVDGANSGGRKATLTHVHAQIHRLRRAERCAFSIAFPEGPT
jgi:hypothetical protein